MIYAAAYDQGLLIMPAPCDGPTPPRMPIVRAHPDPPVGRAATDFVVQPNPFVGTTSFHLPAGHAGGARLGIYDVAGRLVVQLLDGDPTPESAAWDGLDAQRRRAAPGVYFARLESPGRAPLTRKVVVRPR